MKRFFDRGGGRGRHGSRNKRLLVSLAIVLAVVAIQWARDGELRIGDTLLWPPASGQLEEGAGVVERLHAERRSDQIVQVGGRVQRTLADDNDGSRHQRFILELPSGHTVLIAHNIDLAPRVPLEAGDRVEVRGEYEFNERGGVIHWTHRPGGRRHPGGWIEHAGRRYE